MTSSFSQSLIKPFEPSYFNSVQPHSEQPLTLKSSRPVLIIMDSGIVNNHTRMPQEFYDDTNNNSIWNEVSGSDIFEIDKPMNDGEAICLQVSFPKLLNSVYLTQVLLD